MATRVVQPHGSKVYNLTSGATLPTWISDRRKRELSKDLDFRRRIELVQDLEFPTGCQRLEVSRDGQYIVAAGVYPPAVRIFDLAELSLKVERRVDSEVVDLRILSEDYSKIVILQADRHLEFHAAYGRHFRCRVPRFGRTMEYHAPSCELLVGGAGDELYRLDLAEGRFKAPIPVPRRGGVNKLALNPMHGLLAAGCESGEVVFFDPRTKHRELAVLDLLPGVVEGSAFANAAARNKRNRESFEVRTTALSFDASDGLTLGAGTSSGHVLLYDLRSSRPLAVKDHPNGLPICNVAFHNGSGGGGGGGSGGGVGGGGSDSMAALNALEMSLGGSGGGAERRIVSADAKVIKVWSRDYAVKQTESSSNNININGGGGGGARDAAVTNIEPSADANDVCMVRDRRGDTGLMLVAAEQSRILSYYLPELGPAPRWCSFLDVITEELEENLRDADLAGSRDGQDTYDDYKFLTAEEVTQLGLKHLIGTPLLRGYMHGFFVSHKLYNRVKAITQPFAYDEWRKKKVKEKVAAKAQSRIGYREDALALPDVNTELAKRLMLESSKSKRGKASTKKGGDSDSDSDAGGDDGKKSTAKKKDKKRKQQESAAADSVSSKNPLGDDRFRAMFESSDFEVDKDSAEYRIRFPNGDKKARVAETGGGGEDDDDDDDDDDDVAYGRPPWDEDDSGDEAIRSAFGIGGASDAAKRLGAGRGVAGGSDDEFINTDDEDDDEVEDRRGNSRGRRRGFAGDYSDNEEDDDVDDEMPFFGPVSQKEDKPPKAKAKAKAKAKKKKKVAMDDDEQQEGVFGDGALYEIGAGEDAITLLMGTSEDRAEQKKRIEERARPISERVDALSAGAPEATSTNSRPKSFGGVIGNRGLGAGGRGGGKGGGRRGGGKGGGRGRGR